MQNCCRILWAIRKKDKTRDFYLWTRYNPGIKGIPPYPSATCISINDEVIHGIPSKNHIIQEGDIVSIDTVALKNGFHGDAARTFLVGNVDKEAKRLVDITKQAFFEGIE